eukprot:3571568-Rhodomonas_salina.2
MPSRSRHSLHRPGCHLQTRARSASPARSPIARACWESCPLTCGMSGAQPHPPGRRVAFDHTATASR